jgi:tetratricopeptide (TPR) repeat protein
MDALRLYMDDSNDLWINFSDNCSSHIGGPYLYCLDSKTMRFKKEIRLFSDRGNPLTSVFDPQFVSQDQQGNFILATELAYLAKVNSQGHRLYRKRLLHYDFDWTARNRKRKRPYFVRDIQRLGDHEHKKFGRGSTSSLYMMSAAYSKSRDLLFVGQGCHCDPNDVIVYNGAGKYLYHFSAPVGPEAMVARDGLLYLADSYFSLVHMYNYEGKWLRSFDVIFRDTFQGIDQDDEQARHVWRDGFQHELVDADCVVSICGIGEDKLAVGLEKGLIRLLNHDGGLIADILPPVPGLYPNSMVADSSENLFVYYTGDGYFNKPKGLYRYGADGKNKGPLLRGELGIFQPRQKDLETRIAEDPTTAFDEFDLTDSQVPRDKMPTEEVRHLGRCIITYCDKIFLENSNAAYDYFDLADIRIRRKKLSQETIRLLEKSLELKPDLWIAWAYLGLSLKELGEIERAVDCMEKAMEHMNCGVMATALIEFYYLKHDRDKVLLYFKRMEAAEDDFDIEFYSSELTNDQIEQLLGPLVKRNKSNNLVSS